MNKKGGSMKPTDVCPGSGKRTHTSTNGMGGRGKPVRCPDCGGKFGSRSVGGRGHTGTGHLTGGAAFRMDDHPAATPQRTYRFVVDAMNAIMSPKN